MAARTVKLVLLTAALITGADALAQDDDREVDWADCTLEELLDLAGDEVFVSPGDLVQVEFPLPQPDDLSETFQTEDSTVGLFEPPGELKVVWLPQDGDPAAGVVLDPLQGLEDGPEDIVAVGGTGTTLNIGDWNVAAFSTEVKKDAGDAFDTVEEWPDLDAIDWDATRCAIDFYNTVTEASGRATGVLSTTNDEGVTTRDVLVFYGDLAGLIEQIEIANSFGSSGSVRTRIDFIGAKEPFIVDQAYMGTDNGLPPITSFITLTGDPTFEAQGDGNFRLATVKSGRLVLAPEDWAGSTDGEIRNFSVLGDGGALLVEGSGRLHVFEYRLIGNSATGEGGAIYRRGNSHLAVAGNHFLDNTSLFNGGAVAIGGGAPFPGAGLIEIINNRFKNNSALLEGCTLDITFTDEAKSRIEFRLNSVYNEGCEKSLLNNENGTLHSQGNGLQWNRGPETSAIRNGGDATSESSYYHGIGELPPFQQAKSAPKSNPEAACNEAEPAVFTSAGANISNDESCDLDQPTDRPNTDPLMSAPDEDGVSTPLPGSPAIDLGSSQLLVLDEASGPLLPCGYADLYGLGTPQDGDNDGEFECDTGPVEVQGIGEIQAGHSGAFYNSARNGEGQYVEILEGDLAVIYTFTYKPDGSGPAWFVGLANVAGNSLVSHQVQRPAGASFGAAFESGDIDFTPWGGMSMVFPECATGERRGSVAYSGSDDLQYEPLLTFAERLSDITGCSDDVVPHPNAGLSGSFYDPARNGEGLIVQWLPDGQVLTIFFTYGPDGEQMWIFGIDQSDGQSVTIEAVYPTAFGAWGSEYNPNDFVLTPWGTFTLNWTDCHTLMFDYDSDVEDYGSATRNYTRLSKLREAECP